MRDRNTVMPRETIAAAGECLVGVKSVRLLRMKITLSLTFMHRFYILIRFRIAICHHRPHWTALARLGGQRGGRATLWKTRDNPICHGWVLPLCAAMMISASKGRHPPPNPLLSVSDFASHLFAAVTWLTTIPSSVPIYTPSPWKPSQRYYPIDNIRRGPPT